MGNPIGGPRIQGGQATDIAPATAEAGIVYVVGVKPLNPVPAEMNWLAEQPVFEDRYKNNFIYAFSPHSDANSRQLKFTIIPSDKWMRVRTACVKVKWDITLTGTPQPTTFTPLPGFGITNWDQINVLVGSSGIACSNTSMNNPHLQMLNFMGNVKKSDLVLNEWYKMAGFYDFKCFDYCGLIVNSKGTGHTASTAAAITNGVMTDLKAKVTGAGFHYGQPAVDTAMGYPSYCPDSGVSMNYYPFNVRNTEGGMWFDPAMREMRKDFYGSNTTTSTNTLTKVSLFSPPFNTVLLWPPIQLEFQFFYNTDETIRPRGIISPTYSQGAAVDAIITAGGDAAVTSTMKFDKDNCYLLMQFVEMRSDIHQAFLFSWAQNSGAFVQPITWHDLYHQESIKNVNQIQIDLIGQQGLIPYKSLFATRPTFPFASYTATTGGALCPDSNKHFCEFAYGDCGISDLSIDITMPTSRTYYRKMWDLFTRGTDPYQMKSETLRGVRNHEYWMQEKINRNQGFDVAVLEDCDSLHFGDVYKMQTQPPVGITPSQNGKSAVATDLFGPIYGSHSLLANGQTVPLNQGLHNYIHSFLWTPIGVDMPGLNYGVYRGNQRLTAKFSPPPAATITFYALNSYQLCLQIGGNGVAQKNISV